MEPSRGRAKGRGRARGRARGESPDVGAQQGSELGAVGGMPPTTQSQRAQYRGAERPGGLQQQQIAHLEQQMSTLQVEKGKNGSSSGNNNNNGAGRGVTRGRRDISNLQILTTKPQSCQTKRGIAGIPIEVIVNYFKFEKKKDWKLYLYHVDFNAEEPEDRTGIRKKMLRQHAQALGQSYIFDGMQLYMVKNLANQVTELTSKHPVTESPYTVKITFIKELSPYNVQFIQIMNIIMRRFQDYLGMKLVGRNYYNPAAETRREKYNLKIWPGFQTAIRQFEYNILMNADVSHKFMREEKVYDILRKMNQPKRDCEKLLGSVVMTTYNEKTYRLDDFAWDLTPSSTFSTKKGDITYIEYYKQRYNIIVRDAKQPLLVSRPKKRDIRRGMSGNIHLVPELCIMTGLSEDLLSDFQVMKDLSLYLRVTPDKRCQQLLKFSSDLRNNARVRADLTEWGLQLSPNLLKVPARILPDEPITQGGQTFSYQKEKSDWSREMRDKSLNTPMNLDHWSVVFPKRFYDDADGLAQMLNRVGRPMGMILKKPNYRSMETDSIRDYIRQLELCTGEQMVLLILSNNRADRYAAIKKFLSVNAGIPSQCVLTKTLFKKQRLMSVATKIAIQMNCKLGGEVWNLNIPLKNCMVIGYDAYHDSLKRGSSYGAVVTSYNQTWTKYFGQVAEHRNHEELTDNFSTAVRNALHYYIKVNKVPPSTVVVFRDGVGEGQIEYVKEHEIVQVKKTFQDVLQTQPKFSFIVVSKRINTRIMCQPQGMPPMNPSPGTVVDDHITLPERYDFFLVSQSVNQGTVSPTSYNVIEDTSGLKPDHLQRIAYKLTHLYYNWQGTVRVPAPCLYAHKLAFITGQSIHGVAHSNLDNKLWYL